MDITRVAVYIDGFNLYFGLREKGWRKYYWLNVQALAQNLLIPDQQLVVTKYFTARINGHPEDKAKRQETYLSALSTLVNCPIIEGNYLSNTTTCHNCGYQHIDSKEKMTDVNIAVELISDAISGIFDTAILISADSDLTPVLKMVKKLFPDKRLIVGFPPARFSNILKKTADGYFHIYESKFSKSLFPDQIQLPNGHVLTRPDKWK